MNRKKLFSIMNLALIISILFLFVTNTAIAETKTFVKEYNYQASEYDSKVTCRELALQQVKRLLLEEIGTYLESQTEVVNFKLTKDHIIILTAGIVKAEIIEEKWDGKNYWLKAKIRTDPDEVAKAVGFIQNDHHKSVALEEYRKRTDNLLKEIDKLRKELTASKKDK